MIYHSFGYCGIFFIKNINFTEEGITMEVIYWSIIMISFLLSFVGLIYPIIPSVLFLGLGYVLYGYLFTFENFTLLFWVIQISLILLLFLTDYASNLFGVKKLGGKKAAIWGSTIGLIVGPFIIPVIGILIGPFVGAVLAELLVEKKPLKEAVRVGVGSLLGFIGGTVVKFIIQLLMIIYFYFQVS
jgi:uncharacterized protein YqgC (DUF456 family)